MREKVVNAGRYTSHGRELPLAGLCSPVTAKKQAETRIPDALCVPFPMPDVMVGKVVGGDPKGAVVLTTSQRYSREKHRQTHVFCSSSLTLPSFLLSPTPITTLRSSFVVPYFEFSEAPGVFTTFKSILSSYDMPYTIFTHSGYSCYRPLWASTFDIPMDGELFCDCDHYVLDYSYDELMMGKGKFPMFGSGVGFDYWN